jgi:hypothetical protein
MAARSKTEQRGVKEIEIIKQFDRLVAFEFVCFESVLGERGWRHEPVVKGVGRIRRPG